MTSDERPGRPILKIALSGLGAVAVVVAAGAYPTWRMAGAAGLVAMSSGAGASLLAMLGGLVPTALAWHGDAAKRTNAVLLSTAIRFALVLVMAVGLSLSGRIHVGALLIWVGISYIAVLAGESAMMVLLAHRPRSNEE